jgi:cardiolipin synthase C
MAVGPIVHEVSNDFDRYWACASSYPLDRIVRSVKSAKLAEVKSAAARVERDPAALAYTTAIRDSPFVHAVVERRLDFEWAVTRMISDDPAKGLGRAPPEKLFHEQLREIIGDPVSDLELVASYWVPGDTGMERFLSMAKRGVKIKVLTNSLEASDGPYAYSGFAKRRKALLEAGITLYEMRRLSPEKDDSKRAGPLGSSGSSLHAKTFSADRSRFFVGSFNFDPRSRKLNTELGFVIDSPALAQRIEAAFHESIPANSYEVRLSNTGKLYWIERRGDGLVRHEKEPGTSWRLRAAVWFLSRLPIEWLL